MSRSESISDVPEDRSQEAGPSKKTKLQRACDVCRRRKSDGGQKPEKRCSNCSVNNLECTYTDVPKTRISPQKYVEKMENRLKNMERLLRKLAPETRDGIKGEFEELSKIGNYDDDRTDDVPSPQTMESPLACSRAQSPFRSLAASVAPDPFLVSSVNIDDVIPSDDERIGPIRKPLALHRVEERFHGLSSGGKLVQAAMNLKREYLGNEDPMSFRPLHNRDDFWKRLPWEKVSDEHVIHYRYPSEDLLFKLVDCYFKYINNFMPLLHRPTFERALRNGLHYSDSGFASVVLMVCAIGSRYYDDPCVCVSGNRRSAGWMYFDQVQNSYTSLVAAPKLYDIQVYALTALYMFGTSFPQASWNSLGIGIRLALDAGAHRKKVYVPPLTVESELWKRTFWVLVVLDIICSVAMGKPCAITSENYDLDMPIEVDDEYWEHPDPKLAFKQPEGKPSTVAFFTNLVGLTQVQALALRTLYSINESKILLGFVGPTWEQKVVSELDSSLNKWIGNIPEHLRWDPNREDEVFFGQSAVLTAYYYHLQILIHRPFIQSHRKISPLTYSSFAICTNAARSCAHVADVLRGRYWQPLLFCTVHVFESGIILLLNIWSTKKSGREVNVESQMTDVLNCMRVLSTVENRHTSAGRFWDILHELAFAGGSKLDRKAIEYPPTSDTSSPPSAYAHDTSAAVSNDKGTKGKQVALVSEVCLQIPRNGIQHASQPQPVHSARPTETDWTQQFGESSPYGYLSAQQLSQLYPGNVYYSQSLSNPNGLQSSLQLQHSSSNQIPYQQELSQERWSYNASIPAGYSNHDLCKDDPLASQMDDVLGSSFDPGLELWPTAPVSFGFDDWGTYIQNFTGSEQFPDGTANDSPN